MVRFSKVLFVIAMLVCFLDYPYIPVGSLNLKMAYLVFPFYLPIMLYLKTVSVNRGLLVHSFLFILCILPSVLWSTNVQISLSFLFGVIICISIMLIAYKLTSIIGHNLLDIMVYFYRSTIIITIPLVVFGLQPHSHRGSFTLYEPSAWAIAMIPYYSITFHRLLVMRKKAFVVDGIFILAAIVLSASVSMVIWCVLSFAALVILTGRVNFRIIIVLAVCFAALLLASYEFSDRVHEMYEVAIRANDSMGMLMLLTFVAGNRLQRAYMAYQIALDHPFIGVGLGALENYTKIHVNANDVLIMGTSANDFDPSIPATNILLELAAESGICAVVAFLSLFQFVFRKTMDSRMMMFRVSLIVTMVALLSESSYLRPYMWLLFGIALGYGEVCERDIKVCVEG